MELVSVKPLVWLVCLLPLLLAVVLKYSLVDRPGPYKWLATGLRFAAICLLTLALCRPFLAFESDSLHCVFILDVSESVDLAGARKAVDKIETCLGQLGPSDSWSLFLAADGIRHMTDSREAAAELDGWLQTLPDNRFRSASKLADALLMARMCFPANKARRIVLMTDGRATHQDLGEALTTLQRERIDLRWDRLPSLQKAEACLVSITPSATRAFKGEQVRMTVKMRANQRLPATLSILHEGVVAARRAVVLDPDNDNTLHMDVPMLSSGATHWSAELEVDQDHFLVNNRATCTVAVGGRPRILVLHETPRKMRPFATALAEQGLDADLRGKHGLPDTLPDLLSFDAVLLASIAATDLSLHQMALLKRYVVDFGGGLAMFGSNNSFGLGGYYHSLVEEVLPLTSRFEKEKEEPSVAMVLVIDKSGSMNGAPIALARQAAKATVDLMGDQDYIGVVGFDGQAFIVSPMRRATEAETVKQAIDTLAAGGGTFMYPGLETAFNMLQSISAKIKHVILLSDGMSQPADHQGLVADMARMDITVSTIALGQADRALLASLADIGKGRYYETTDPASIPQIFTKETLETSGSAVKEDLCNQIQTSDHPLLSGFGSVNLPVVFGYVMTHVKPATQLLLVAHTGDPLLAVARYGLGTTLAYTSDVTDKWGSQWLTWPAFGRFWAQALRGILRRESAEGLHLEQIQERDQWTIHVTCLDPAGRPMTGVDFQAQTVADSEGVNSVPVEEIGLGRYRMVIPIGDRESLSLRLEDRQHGKTATLHYNRPYPAEYNLSGGIDPALAELPRLDSRTLREDILPVTLRRPIHLLCYALALIAMLLGMLFRRI